MQRPGFNSTRALAALGVLASLVMGGGLLWTARPTPSASARPAVVPFTSEPRSPDQAEGPDTWPALAGLATFGDGVKLLAFTLPDHPFPPGGIVKVALYWQTQAVTTRYAVFGHILDADNNLVAQADAPLTNTPCMSISQHSAGMIPMCYSLVLPDQLPAGRYQLVLGVYDTQRGARLATAGGETMVYLTTIEVQPAGVPATSKLN